jgi:hypothetical protein
MPIILGGYSGWIGKDLEGSGLDLCMYVCMYVGRAVAQRLDAGFPPRLPGFATGSMWCLWWTKLLWGRFSPSISVSPANHSTDFSIIIITRG